MGPEEVLSMVPLPESWEMEAPLAGSEAEANPGWKVPPKETLTGP
jgi:hypothetical protein